MGVAAGGAAVEVVGAIVAAAGARVSRPDVEVGVAAPQVSEIALGLNRDGGTRYHFILLDEAAKALAEGLGGGCGVP